MTKLASVAKQELLDNIESAVVIHIKEIDGVIDTQIKRGYNTVELFPVFMPVQIVADRIIKHYESHGYMIKGRWLCEKYLIIEL